VNRESKTERQLIDELEEARRRIAELERSVEEHGRMVDALRESERRLMDTIRFLPDPTLIIDREGRIVVWNSALEKLSGIKAEDMIGKGDYEYAVPFYGKRRPILIDLVKDSPERINEEYINLESRDDVLSGEARMPVSQAGRRLYLYGVAAAIRNSRGEVIGAIESVRDVTERKRIEEELRESEERYRTVFENTGTATVIIEKDTIISLANAEYERLSGYTKDEIEGKMSWTETTVKEDLDRMLEQHKLRRQDRDQALRSYEFRFVRRSGEIRHVYLVIDTIPGTDKSVASLTDITDRKLAEEALRESEERFRNLMEYMPGVSIQGFTPDGTVLYWNKTSESVYGYSAREAIGKRLMDLIVPKDLRSAFEELLAAGRRVTRSGEYSPPGEFTGTHKDGHPVPVYSTHTAIYLEGKEPLLFCLDVDLSEHKRLESQFLQSQKMESIGVLAGGIAHDFNNLLMGIQGYVSLMLGDLEAGHPHFQRLKNIENLVRGGSNLTGQLLGFARGGKYEVRATDLNALMTRSADMFERTRQEITIHRRLAPDLAYVEVDQGQIEQVLLNLFVNAGEAMPQGGELTLEARNVTLGGGLHLKPGRYVEISVRDTGIGMDPATQQRVFEPFFTTKEMGRGSGLGLASAYGIIKNHGGIIQVSSQKGKGSTFTIYLPASEKRPVTEKTTPALPGRRSTSTPGTRRPSISSSST
jgi:PAS domain S-box-containing protein